MGSTLVEKLMAGKTESHTAHAGELVSVAVDRLLFNDYVGALVFSKLDELKQTAIVHPEKVFLAIDHNVPAFTVDAADKHVLFREKAKQFGIKHISRIGQHGIGHQMMVEDFVKPLELAVGTDSHATMYAGIGAFSCGITTSDALAVLMGGRLWMKVPESIRINVCGVIPRGVTAKDIGLKILSLYPEEVYTYKAVEIVGEAIEAMSVESRLVLANLIAEVGAKCAVFEADEKAYHFAGLRKGACLRSDADAAYYGSVTLDVSNLTPMLSCPHAVTNVHPADTCEGEHVDQVFIGSCTNGRLEDLHQAAEILRGKTVAKGTRLIVTPASQRIALAALQDGTMETLMKAGAVILPASCASCAGCGPGLVGRGECCVSTTNRNFKGRMGSMESRVYLGSAYTAAACAVTGRVTDPRGYLSATGGTIA